MFRLARNRDIKELMAEIKVVVNTSNAKWYFICECFPTFDNYMLQNS